MALKTWRNKKPQDNYQANDRMQSDHNDKVTASQLVNQSIIILE